MKEKKRKGARLPKTFVESYHSESHVIDKGNFTDFVI